MYQAGGRIEISFNGSRYSPRGKATIKPAGLQHSGVANHDGTAARTTVAKLVEADLTFDRGSAQNNTARPKWDSGFMQPFYGVTIKETDVGVMHIFSNASIIGDPALDTETGEVTGLTIQCAAADYVQTNI